MCRRKSILLAILVLAVFLIVAAGTAALASPSEFWGKLEPGPYGIGFRTVEKYDYSRTFGDKRDYFGNPLPGEKARPIQICTWYPANTSDEDVPITYAEYAYSYPEDESFIRVLAAIQNREIGLIQSFIGGNRGFVMDLFNRPVAAVRNAEPYDSAFPLIIYHPQFQTCISENAVLCEYLASYGFVVATSHPMGMHRISPDFDQAGMLTAMRDREFVAAFMRDRPGVDYDRIGLLGSAAGGGSALLMQMRNNSIGAVAGIGGSFTETILTDLISQNAYFDISRAVVPVMQLYPNTRPSEDTAFFASLKYAPRYSYSYTGLTPANFVQIGTIRCMLPDSSGNIGIIRDQGYEAVCRRVFHFFNATLNNSEQSLAMLEDNIKDTAIRPDAYTYSYYDATERPPSRDQFVSILRERGVSTAVEIFDKFRAIDSSLILFNEPYLNYMGYQNLQSGRTTDALHLFRMNAETYPQSPNVWDSYADGCLAAADTAQAILCYQKVLEALSGDTNIDEQLRATLKQNAERGLQNLKIDQK